MKLALASEAMALHTCANMILEKFFKDTRAAAAAAAGF